MKTAKGKDAPHPTGEDKVPSALLYDAPDRNRSKCNEAPRVVDMNKEISAPRSVVPKKTKSKGKDARLAGVKEKTTPASHDVAPMKNTAKEKNAPRMTGKAKAPPSKKNRAPNKTIAANRDSARVAVDEPCAHRNDSSSYRPPDATNKAAEQVFSEAVKDSHRRAVNDTTPPAGTKGLARKEPPAQTKKRRLALPADSTSSSDDTYSSHSSFSSSSSSSHSSRKHVYFIIEEENEDNILDYCIICGDEVKLVIRKSGKGIGKATRQDNWVECALQSHSRGTSSWAHFSCEGISKSIGYRRVMGDKDYLCKTFCKKVESWKAQWASSAPLQYLHFIISQDFPFQTVFELMSHT